MKNLFKQRKTLYTIAICLFLLSCKKNKEITPTQIEFKTFTHDFGEIHSKKEVNKLFNFTNIGNRPLVITDVKTSCSCTVSKWTKEAIKSNESGKIKVIYDAKSPGRFKKTITVFYNGKDSPKELVIKGEVNYPETE